MRARVRARRTKRARAMRRSDDRDDGWGTPSSAFRNRPAARAS